MVYRTPLILFLPAGVDLLKVWHSAEDHHLYQKQSVPGSDSVLGRHDGSARQAGEQTATRRLCISDPVTKRCRVVEGGDHLQNHSMDGVLHLFLIKLS